MASKTVSLSNSWVMSYLPCWSELREVLVLYSCSWHRGQLSWREKDYCRHSNQDSGKKIYDSSFYHELSNKCINWLFNIFLFTDSNKTLILSNLKIPAYTATSSNIWSEKSGGIWFSLHLSFPKNWDTLVSSGNPLVLSKLFRIG